MWPGNAHFWSQSAKSFNVMSKLFDRVVLQQRMFFWYKSPLNNKISGAHWKYWIKNISRKIGAAIFKLGARNVHRKRNRMAPTILLPWQHSWLQSLSVKNQISPFATFLSGTRGLLRNRHGSHIVLTLPIRLLGVDDPYQRWNLGVLVLLKTGPGA